MAKRKDRAVRDAYPAAEAARLTGFQTTYMLDYLKRTRVVEPSKASEPGRGRRRLYSYGDLILLRAVRQLLAEGISVKRLQDALTVVRKKFKGLRPDVVVTRFMITDGQSVFLKDDISAVIDLTADGQYAFAFVVDLKRVQAEVHTQILHRSA